MNPNANSEAFYAGALTRISNSMIVLAVLFTGGSWILYGGRIAVGLAFGCAIAYTETSQPQSSKGVVLRFLLRYVLMAVAAYVIFSVSPASLYGLFAGLFLPVAAIACEAAYEAYAALARGI